MLGLTPKISKTAALADGANIDVARARFGAAGGLAHLLSETFFPSSEDYALSQVKYLEINIADIKCGKHPSDTGSIDADGNFVREKFEEIFAKYDTDGTNKLSFDDLVAMLKANRKASGSTAGEIASFGEFGLYFLVATDKTKRGPDGKVVRAFSKARLRDLRWHGLSSHCRPSRRQGPLRRPPLGTRSAVHRCIGAQNADFRARDTLL